MSKKQPFLSGFPTTFSGSFKRGRQALVAAQRRLAVVRSLVPFALQFEAFLPDSFLRSLSQTRRERGFGNVATFWAWLAMMLESNASLSRGLKLMQAARQDAGLPAMAPSTSSFSKARSRLSKSFILSVFDRVNSVLRGRIREEDKWRGLVVKSMDGSSVQILDTADNQKVYPQPSSQKKGCGLPIINLCAVLNHAHGGWEKVVLAAKKHDANMARQLLGCFRQGVLALGDRAFGSWEMIARLGQQGAHGLFRLHQRRQAAKDFRRGKKIGSKHERLLSWTRPVRRPRSGDLSQEEWQALPEQITVRIIRFQAPDRSGKLQWIYLSTSLLDTKEYPWDELAEIYFMRWDIELRLRDVKTTMGLDLIRAKTPEMAEKSLMMGLIACNLVRASIQEAAQEAGRDLRRISFKGTLETITGYSPRWKGRWSQPHKCREIWMEMREVISGNVIPHRPGRSEPRALKRRPKPFSYLTCERAKYKELPHRGKRRKAA